MTVYMGHNCWLGTFGRKPSTVKPMTKWAIKHDIPMLYNAHFDYNDSGFKDFTTLPLRTTVDSGGFHTLNTHGEYPWTVADYDAVVKRSPVDYDWVAPMDYPIGFDTDRERMEHTFENYQAQVELADYRVMPVLHGGDIDEYLDMYDWYADAGYDVDYIGIGGLVPIKAPTRVAEISQRIRDYVPSSVTIHGFGVKFNELKHGADFDTVDTATWTYYYSNGKALIYDRDPSKLSYRSFESYKQAMADCFWGYYCYLRHLLDGKPCEVPRPVVE